VNIAFLVNDVSTERPLYSTTQMAMEAVARGHDVWYFGVGEFSHTHDDPYGDPYCDVVCANARQAPQRRHRKPEAFLEAVQEATPQPLRVAPAGLDVLVLRNDIAQDIERPWAQWAGVLFGQLAVRRGVIVVNDPYGLAQAMNKLYLLHFPPEVRPATLVTRDPDQVRAFIAERGGHAVLKPLVGSGGQSVFMVHPHEDANVNQIIEVICRDGYLVAQEYLPAAEKGDVRLLLLDGRPLTVDGAYAAFRRIPQGADPRSNTTAGGTEQPATVDGTVLALAEAVRPKLKQDGMFFVGLDIAGDKLMEINVFSPGGLVGSARLTGVDFTPAVIASLERKVRHMRSYGHSYSNRELATL
jgi:glutathione synthase